ncbi:MAG: 4Fe-4S binding protein [Chitinivibrionales bacterium]|nr:4Fe-4S binding protein [Chitinivibrionales bacterium]
MFHNRLRTYLSRIAVSCAILAVSIAAQTKPEIDISGTITDPNGSPAANVIVSLKKQTTIKDTTDSQGKYRLYQTATGITTTPTTAVKPISFLNNRLYFVAPNAGTMSISLFSLQGKKIASVFEGTVLPGMNIFPMPQQVIAQQPVVLNITINNQQYLLKSITLRNTSSSIEFLPTENLQLTALTGTVSDTFIATAPSTAGYPAYKKFINNYKQTIDVKFVSKRVPISSCPSYCGRCVSACPNGAISNKGGRAAIDATKCKGVDDTSCKGRCTSACGYLKKPAYIEMAKQLVSSFFQK